MEYIRYILLAFSLLGFSGTISKKGKLPLLYSMPISAAIIIIILFCISLISQIKLYSYILLAIGLALFCLNVYLKAYSCSDSGKLPFILAGIILFGVFVLLQGQRLAFVDDFRHWGRMCRSIIENQSLPTEVDTLIEYKSYPPGAALWVCFVVNVVGQVSEDWFLIAQATLILIMLLPFFQYVSCILKRAKWTSIGLYVLFVFSISWSILLSRKTAMMFSLCPEPLLAANALAAFIVIYDNRKNVTSKVIYILPLIILMYLIKDAGILFSVIDILLIYIISHRNTKQGKRIFVSVFIPAFFLLIIFAIWQYHVSRSFSSSISPHSLNLDRWASNIQNYTVPEVKQIIYEFLYCTFKMEPVIIASVCFIFLAMHFLAKKNQANITEKNMKFLIFMLLNYILYLAGMLFVYLFSMEKENAIKAGSYSRYVFVVQMYIIGITMVFLSELMIHKSDSHIKFKWSCLYSNISKISCIFSIILLIICCGENIRLNTKYQREETVREKNMSLLEEKTYPDLAVYAPYQMVPTTHKNHIESEIVYDARTTDVDILDICNEEEFNTLINHHSYLMICDIDESLEKWISDKQVNISGPGIYEIALLK